MKTNAYCLECKQPISAGVNEFSQSLYGHPLCMKDQYLLEESGATALVVDMYLALKSRNFPVVLGYCDGYNFIDIAIPGKLYIEFIDSNDYTNRRLMTDLAWSVYLLEKKIPTIVIPDTLLSDSQSFANMLNEISKSCRVMLNQISIMSLVPAFESVQLQ
jgi:hypothetical protein